MVISEAQTVEQNVAYLHGNGELQEARDAEAAARMCPFLGKMSLEEVGLLLELQTIGHTAIEEEPVGEPEHKLPNEAESVSLFSQVFESSESANRDKAGGLEPAQTEDVLNISQEFTEQITLETGPVMVEQFIVGNSSGTEPIPVTNEETPQATATEDLPLISPAQEAPIEASTETVRESVATITAESDFESQPKRENRAPLKIVPTDRPATYRPLRSVSTVMTPASSRTTPPPTIPAQKPPETRITTGKDPGQQASQGVDSVPVGPEKPVDVHESQTTDASLTEIPDITELRYILNDEEHELPERVPDLLYRIESSDTDTKKRAFSIVREIITTPANSEAAAEIVLVSAETQLEQLVAELLVTLSIECSPQDLNNYVAAVRTYLLDGAHTISMEQEDEIRRLSHDIGTNEFVHQVQQYFVPARNNNSTLSSIGRSILRLYERIAPATAS